jgi:hypothetical protein
MRNLNGLVQDAMALVKKLEMCRHSFLTSTQFLLHYGVSDMLYWL